MSALPSSLRYLLAAKLRARGRAARRRLGTVPGVLFGVVGVVLLALWIGGLVARVAFTGEGRATAEPVLRAGLLAYALLALGGGLLQRGLYFPRAEVERLLAAPVSRSALIRYRLASLLLPNLLFGAIVGLVIAPRVHSTGAAVAGSILLALVLATASQGVALLTGDARGRLARWVDRVPSGAIRVAFALGMVGLALLAILGGGGDPAEPTRLEPGDLRARLVALATHPVVAWSSAPLTPWSRAISAPDLAASAPWLLVGLALLVVAVELVARLGVDFREYALRTAAEVEERFARVRRAQGGIASSRAVVSKGFGAVPWLFGRGPMGAVAWLQVAAIARRARGALLLIAFLGALGVVFGVQVMRAPVEGAATLALLGIVYLASGLRFDFRGLLDHMEVVRAWPLPAWRVFVGTLAPTTALISIVVLAVLLVRAALTGGWSPGVLVVAASTPLAAYLWLALDNAVYLLFPVRFQPGQGSVVQHTGRSLVLLALRLLLLAAFGGGAALAAWGATAGVAALGGGAAAALTAATASAVATGIAGAVVLSAFGGWALTRFDVARERIATT